MILDAFYEVEACEDGDTALRKLTEHSFDLVLLDIMMPGKDGLQVLRELRQFQPTLPVIVISALDQAKIAVEALKLGAINYEVKPFDKDKIRTDARVAIENYQLKTKLTRLQSEIERTYQFQNIVGGSKPMREIFSLIQRVADTDSTVLIQGESGTGKELAARALHYNSARRDNAFLAFDCGAVAKELIESELFGHEKGAFTGALIQRQGLFEAAHGGTLFLDEIGEMEIGLQSRLLRVLQERQIRRVGSNKAIDVDVRLVAATSRNLANEIAAGRFREDLFFRVNVVPIHLPALRERADDIPLLIGHFAAAICKNLGHPPPHFAAETVQLMVAYPWPGNVRELRNCIERVLVLSEGKSEIVPDDLPPNVRKGEPLRPAVTAVASPVQSKPGGDIIAKATGNGKTLDELVAEVEREAIQNAVREANGVLSRAAALLGTTRRILKYKMDKLGMAVSGENGEAASAPEED
jgi:DNA-binding NtrC family response regulator